MKTPPFDHRNLPPLMTSEEVCALGRIERRTLSRWVKGGILTPMRPGSPHVFHRQHVLHALGIEDLYGAVSNNDAEPVGKNHDHIDMAGYRAAIEAARKPKRPEKLPQPKPEPMRPDERRAFMLSIRPGIRVRIEDDGRYMVAFVARSNNRASTWPAEIMLPRACPCPVALVSAEEFDLLDAEAVALHAECKAALAAERAR